MLNKTIYEWVGVNSHSMSWPEGTKSGLDKQIVVKANGRTALVGGGGGLFQTFIGPGVF